MKNNGAKKMLEWLRYCLSIGWKESDIKGLRDVWIKFKDEDGNLKHINS